MTRGDIVVYISGPYTKPDPPANTLLAMDLADDLMEAGFAVICPHLSHFQNLYFPRDYESYMANDLALVRRSDAVLRFPGESPGADRECELARSLRLPVFTSMDELMAWSDALCPDSVPYVLRPCLTSP